MRPISLAIAVLVLASSSQSMQARQAVANTKPDMHRAQTTCARCEDLAKQLNQAYDSLNFLWDRKLSLQKSIATTEGVMAARSATIERLESAVPRSGRTLPQQQNIDAIRNVNAQQRSGVERQRRDLGDVDARIAEQNQLIARLLARLAECEKQCQTPPVNPPIPPVEGPRASIGINTKGEPQITVPCPQCDRYASVILRLWLQREALQAELDDLELEFTETALGLPPVVGRMPKISARGPGGVLGPRKRDGFLEELEDTSAELRQVEFDLYTTWTAVTVCVTACNLQTRPIYTRPAVYGSTIGLGLLGAVTSVGANGPKTMPTTTTVPPPVTVTAVAPTVVTTPSPAPTPAPAPTPTPAPRISAEGSYKCSSCTPTSDNGRHNAVINLCPQLLSDFVIRDFAFTVVHPAPFVALTGDFNTTSGAFTSTGRGTVAGFPNVGVLGDGMFDANTGRIMLRYTMGTGSELPGGQSITYAITLQKQP
jgi:hypothetical protein